LAIFGNQRKAKVEAELSKTEFVRKIFMLTFDRFRSNNEREEK